MAANVPFTLSSTPGAHEIYVQFQGSAGEPVTVNLSQPIIFTPNAPAVTLTAPADGAIITSNTTITATASDAIGVTKVDFFVDGAPLATVTTPAYSTPWDISAVPNGTHVIKAVATNALLLTAQDTHTVTVQKTGDTTGPSVTYDPSWPAFRSIRVTR